MSFVRNFIALYAWLTIPVFITACQPEKHIAEVATAPEDSKFVQVRGEQMLLNGKPYYFVGTNFWYGAYLGAPSPLGDRDRLLRELDSLKHHGITNLRVLAASETSELTMSIRPAMQDQKDVSNTQLLEGLDFLLVEMAKRDMKAVLFLNNFWQWSGGMAQYVSWASGEALIDPDTNGDWPGFIDYAARFYQLPQAQERYRRWIDTLLERRNSISGVLYREDPTIMTWELANEPRPGNHDADAESIRAYIEWVDQTAGYIKQRAPYQLVTTGNEGIKGSIDSEAVYMESHASEHIDYLTFHMWPKNWSWLDIHDPEATYAGAEQKATDYVRVHIDIARRLGKPTVFEEFGVERDGGAYAAGASTVWRDRLFETLFDQIYQSAARGEPIAGSNFWAWSGAGRSDRDDAIWQTGDAFLGDPPQEPQGLNSVFDTDQSTLAILSRHAQQLKSLEQP